MIGTVDRRFNWGCSSPTHKTQTPAKLLNDALPGRRYPAEWEALAAPSLVKLIGLCYSKLVNEPRFPTLLLLLPVEHLRRVYTLVSDLLNNRSR
jgi:hypothetical protein